MAKSAQQQSQEAVKSAKIPVFNHTNHSIGIAIRKRPAGTAGRGGESYTVRFLPGNNSVDSDELEKCKAHPLWNIHADRQEHRGILGKAYKGVDLQVGHHDKDFEVESRKLGERMHQLKELQRARAL